MSTLVVGRDGRILFMDLSFREYFSCSAHDVVGASLSDLVMRSTSSLDEDELGQIVAGRREVRGYIDDVLVSVSLRRIGFMTHDGQATISSYGLPRALVEDESAAFIATVTCLAMMQAEVASQLRATVGRVMSGFAHEVRNPLAAITSLSEAAVFLSEDPDIEDTLSRIPALVDRVESLIQLLLAYGKPTEPKLGWHKLERIVGEAIDVLRHASVLDVVSVRPEMLLESELYVDDTQIVSVLTNLLQNAAQAGGASGVELRLAVVRGGGGTLHAVVDVVDRGGGVPEELREKIFEPFFTRRTRGTGLGLALARDLSRMNGGDVTLVSTGASGSTFRLMLPMRSARVKG